MKRIEIDAETGICSVVTRDVITNPEGLLRRLTPGLSKVISITNNINYVVDSSSDYALAVCRLDSISLCGSWFGATEGDNAVLYPFINNRATKPLEGDLRMEWPVPEGLNVIFTAQLCTTTQDDVVSPTNSSQGCHLMFLDDDGVARAPALPNVYNDGALCTGHLNPLVVEGRRLGALELIEHTLAAWSTNAWNADLTTGGYEWKLPLLKEVSKFDAATMKPAEVKTSDWLPKCPVMGTVPGQTEVIKEGCRDAIKSLLSFS